MKKVGYSNTSFSIQDALLWRFDKAMLERRMKNKTALLSDLIERWIEDERIAQKGYVRPTISDDPRTPNSGYVKGDGTSALGNPRDRGEIVLQPSLDDEISKEEMGWFHRLLRLLRSGSPSVHQALRSNFTVFEEALEYERQRHTDDATPEPSKPVTAERVNEALSKADRLAGDTNETLRRSKRTEGKHARKARKRG